MLEFILTFRGRLSTTSHVKMKFTYRRQFLEQLRVFRDHMKMDNAPPDLNFQPENQIRVEEFLFIPLVTKRSKRVVDLDIILLTNSGPAASTQYPTGDIDNYLKALLDGLRMAQTKNEIRDEKPLKGEEQFFCLLEDDQSVRNINITHHKNFTPQIAKGDPKNKKGAEVFALIKVKIFDKYSSFLQANSHERSSH